MQSPAYPADVQHDTASRHPRRSVWPRGHQAGTDAQPHAGKPTKNVLTCTDDTQARRSSAVVLGAHGPTAQIHRPGPGGERGRTHPGAGRASSGDRALHRRPVGSDPPGGGGIASAQRPQQAQRGTPGQHAAPTQRRGSRPPTDVACARQRFTSHSSCPGSSPPVGKDPGTASLGATAAARSGLSAGDEGFYVGT